MIISHTYLIHTYVISKYNRNVLSNGSTSKCNKFTLIFVEISIEVLMKNSTLL